MTITVTSCRDCPMFRVMPGTRTDYGHCTATKALATEADAFKLAERCPLRTGDVVVTLKR